MACTLLTPFEFNTPYLYRAFILYVHTGGTASSSEVLGSGPYTWCHQGIPHYTTLHSHLSWHCIHFNAITRTASDFICQQHKVDSAAIDLMLCAFSTQIQFWCQSNACAVGRVLTHSTVTLHTVHCCVVFTPDQLSRKALLKDADSDDEFLGSDVSDNYSAQNYSPESTADSEGFADSSSSSSSRSGSSGSGGASGSSSSSSGSSSSGSESDGDSSEDKQTRKHNTSTLNNA
jgi:hypothetical protein